MIRYSRNIILLLAILTLLLTYVTAHAEGKDSRTFNQSKISSLKVEKEYSYNLKQVTYTPSLWERFWNKVLEFLELIFSTKKEIAAIRLLVVISVIILAAVLIYRMNFTNSFSRRANDTASSDIPFINIREIDFNEIIARAEKEKNYTMAIRYYFLKYLSLLDRMQTISYNKHKSNFDYLYEITNTQYRTTFRKLMLIQESVVYGHKEATAGMLDEVRTVVDSFNTSPRE